MRKLFLGLHSGYCTTHERKTKMQQTAQLICIFVFADIKILFSQNATEANFIQIIVKCPILHQGRQLRKLPMIVLSHLLPFILDYSVLIKFYWETVQTSSHNLLGSCYIIMLMF